MKTTFAKTILLLTSLFASYAANATESQNPTFGEELTEAQPHTLNMFAMGDGTIRAFTAVNGTTPAGEEILDGTQFIPAECPDGLYLLVEADQFFFLHSLYVNDEEVTDLVEDGVYHCENVDDDVQVAAVFDVELAHINQIISDLPAGSFEIYNLQGSQVDPNHLTAGFYLFHHGAQTVKVYLK